MKVYLLRDNQVMAMQWFATKAEAMKRFNRSGGSGHHMEVSVVEFGNKKSDLINLLNNFATNWDEYCDDPDMDFPPMKATHSETSIKEKNEF